MDTTLKAEDVLIVIAADEDRITLSSNGAGPIDNAAIHGEPEAPRRAERILVLGWNWRGVHVLRALDQYLAAGSEVTVISDDGTCELALSRLRSLRNLTVRYEHGDTTDRRTLENAEARGFDHAIVVSPIDHLGPQRADGRTFLTLLHLRDIGARTGRPLPIVSEMLDSRNRTLVAGERADDFIVSDRIASQLMAQVAENKALNAVFTELFDPEGAEIYLKPVALFVRTELRVTYATVVEAARRRGEATIGFRIASLAADAGRAYGIFLNPSKDETMTFESGDKVIVLATD